MFMIELSLDDYDSSFKEQVLEYKEAALDDLNSGLLSVDEMKGAIAFFEERDCFEGCEGIRLALEEYSLKNK